MIVLPEIPVEISPKRLAALVGLSAEEAGSFLDQVHDLIKPSAVFDEVDPMAVLGAIISDTDQAWGAQVIIGLCSLGTRAGRLITETPSFSSFWPGLSKLALRDALDYLEYRVRLYLRPAGLEPGDLLVPGCQALPLAANQVILKHCDPEQNLGLTVDLSGEIDSRAGIAFVYTTEARSKEERSRCANCSRADCPARL
ncbi:MAG: hypothetical protein JRI34_13345 [Deltaproteobacteria bacterium]|nr:hypothetical protein [Deltaproteobacteria bacterium]